jgi:hypothetical protein
LEKHWEEQTKRPRHAALAYMAFEAQFLKMKLILALKLDLGQGEKNTQYKKTLQIKSVVLVSIICTIKWLYEPSKGHKFRGLDERGSRSDNSAAESLSRRPVLGEPDFWCLDPLFR